MGPVSVPTELDFILFGMVIDALGGFTSIDVVLELVAVSRLI